MGQPHKHAALIKAWADGAEIQYSDNGSYWYDLPYKRPSWEAEYYRIKPKPPVYEWQWIYFNATDFKMTRNHYKTAAEAQSQITGTVVEKYGASKREAK